MTRFGLLFILLLTLPSLATAADRHLLYVAEPGIRNYVQWGGVGVLVYDMDHGHKLVKRIPTLPTVSGEEPEAVKGVCASAKTGRLYVSTVKRLLCIDLRTEKLLWNRAFVAGCDRMAISPDGQTIYLPSLEGPIWHIVNANTGDLISTVEPKSGSHNTIYGPDGKRVYLAGLKSTTLGVADTSSHTLTTGVGPFGNVVRPLTINASQTLCFVNVNDLLGFEVGDIKTGRVLHRVEVSGEKQGPVERHGCPSHGIGLTPDEKELWLCDAANKKVHIFDATVMPPRQLESIVLREQPGWVTFSLDGRYAYPSTGDVIDVKNRKIVTGLADENGNAVQSEKMVEIDFNGDRPVRNGDQFGIGRKRK